MEAPAGATETDALVPIINTNEEAKNSARQSWTAGPDSESAIGPVHQSIDWSARTKQWICQNSRR